VIDCLLLVERGVSEPDLVKGLLASALGRFFRSIREDVGEEERSLRLLAAGRRRSVLADYGLATQVSLTSVVLATELARTGLSFAVIDDDDVADLYREVLPRKLSQARMVAVSTTYTVRLASIVRLLRLLRTEAPDLPVLVGGQGLSAWRLHFEEPARLFARLADADALFFGEAEGTFAELVRRMIERRSLAGIPGAVARGPAGWEGRPEPIEADLEAAALPDWSLLFRHDVNDGAVSRRAPPHVASLEEGRGCSFKCKFCSYPLYASFRRKSPERLVAELAAVEAAGFRTAAFCGAEFLSPLDKSRHTFAAIAAAGLDLDLWAYARLDLVSHHPWLAEAMDRARFRFIQFGMESGDRSVLRAMRKNYDPDRMAVGARLLAERQIAIYASLIVGYPGESEETIANTLAVLADCDFEHVIVHALSVVPGSPLWHRRQEYGLSVSPAGWWSHPTMSLREVPAVVKGLVVEITRRTRSLLNNLTQNFANRFFEGHPTLAELAAVTRILQEAVVNEWQAGGPEPATSRRLWAALRERVDRVPVELLGEAGDLRPLREPAAALPLHPLGA
jgi:p-methyltransferase